MTVKNKLKLFGAYFFRWVGFSTEPKLIKVGNPTKESPVLLTCNFILTVKRVLKAIKGLDCYLLVAPSNGINVWCGACGDDFHTDSVLSIIKTSKINDMISHRTLILPQLSAPGIDPILIKKKTGWDVKFGPVYAKDISNYIKNDFTKTRKMREVKFTISKRIEMANLYFFSLAVMLSLFYWITALFLNFLDLFLYLDSIILMIIVIYGALIILPSIKTKTGRPKALIFEALIVVLIILFYIFLFQNIFYLIWNIILSILVAFIL
ncbi:MAG: HgcAB-like fusion protein, partial [Promethearchaeota archaeon]